MQAKLILIHNVWLESSDEDPRLKYFADLRADDLKPEARKEPPLEQFVEGYWCGNCGKGFVSEEILRENRWRYS